MYLVTNASGNTAAPTERQNKKARTEAMANFQPCDYGFSRPRHCLMWLIAPTPTYNQSTEGYSVESNNKIPADFSEPRAPIKQQRQVCQWSNSPNFHFPLAVLTLTATPLVPPALFSRKRQLRERHYSIPETAAKLSSMPRQRRPSNAAKTRTRTHPWISK